METGASSAAVRRSRAVRAMLLLLALEFGVAPQVLARCVIVDGKVKCEPESGGGGGSQLVVEPKKKRPKDERFQRRDRVEIPELDKPPVEGSRLRDALPQGSSSGKSR